MDILLIGVLALAAIALVAYPLLRPGRRPAGPEDAALEAEVARYRAALRAETVCPKCLEANPADSRYCADCGRALREDEDVEPPP